MIAGMAEVIPGMRVTVDSIITRSLSKTDLDPRYAGGTTAQPAETPASICAVPCDAFSATNTDGSVEVSRPEKSDVPTREIVPSQRTSHT